MSGLAWRLRILAEAPSTNDLLAQLAVAGAPEGTALLARLQTAGRGRAGRGWDSAEGNLHLSVLLRPSLPLRFVPLFGLAAGVALAEVSAAALPPAVDVRLKWPNDLLLNGAKAGGILAEATTDPSGAIAHLILGIGVNLAHAPTLPDRMAACFSAFGPAPDAVGFAGTLLEVLGGRIADLLAHGARPICDAWLGYGPPLGSLVSVRGNAGLRSGRFGGLAADGSLLLEQDGMTHVIAAGEVGA